MFEIGLALRGIVVSLHWDSHVQVMFGKTRNIWTIIAGITLYATSDVPPVRQSFMSKQYFSLELHKKNYLEGQ